LANAGQALVKVSFGTDWAEMQGVSNGIPQPYYQLNTLDKKAEA